MDWKEKLRERLKRSRLWTLALLIGSGLNVVFAWPTVWNVWHSEELAAFSIMSSWMLLYIQLIFAANGWVYKDKFLNYSGVGAAMSTAAILVRLYQVKYHLF